MTIKRTIHMASNKKQKSFATVLSGNITTKIIIDFASDNNKNEYL